MMMIIINKMMVIIKKNTMMMIIFNGDDVNTFCVYFLMAVALVTAVYDTCIYYHQLFKAILPKSTVK